MSENATAKSLRVWNAMASHYDRDMRIVERLLFPDGRAWIGDRARGQVLDVAVGTGRNLAFYPAGTRVTGIELSPSMLALARERAGALGIEADLREGDAQALPFADASFDTVVCTLSLCAIPDDQAALREMARVLRPGGTLLLLDHIGSRWRPLLALQRLAERLTIRLQGEHLTRRPSRLLPSLGLGVRESNRTKGGVVELVSAVKPAYPGRTDA